MAVIEPRVEGHSENLAEPQNHGVYQKNTTGKHDKHRPISDRNDDDANQESDCPKKQGTWSWPYSLRYLPERSHNEKLIQPASDQTSDQNCRHTHISHPSCRQKNDRETACSSENLSKTCRRVQHCGFPDMVHPALTAEDPRLAAFEPATAAALDTWSCWIARAELAESCLA